MSINKKIIVFLAIFTLLLYNLTAQTLVPQTGHKDSVRRVVFSPDGKMFATGARDSTIKIWDSETLIEIGTLAGHTTSLIESISFSPDGNLLVSCATDNTVRVWDINTRKEIHQINMEKTKYAVFGPNSKRLIIATGNKNIKIWNLDTDKEMMSFDTNTDIINYILYEPSLEYIIFADSNIIRILNAGTAVIEKTFTGHTKNIISMAISPDKRFLVSGSEDSIIRCWDLTGDDSFYFDTEYEDTNIHVGFTQDGKYITSHSRQGTTFWDFTEKKNFLTIPNSEVSNTAYLILSPDSKKIFTFLNPRRTRDMFVVQDATNGTELSRIQKNNDELNAMSINSIGNIIAVSSVDQSIKLWDLTEGKLIRTLQGHTDNVTAVNFSPDGRRIASASNDKRIIIWNTDNGNRLQSYHAHQAAIRAISFNSQGTRILSSSADSTVKIWNTSDSSRVWVKTHENSAWSTLLSIISRDGRYAVSAYYSIQIREIENGNLFREINLPERVWCRSLVFSNDGKRLITGTSDNKVIIWDWEKNEQLQTFSDNEVSSYAISICPEDKVIAFGSNNRIILQNIGNEQSRLISGHERNINAVRFTPNGKALVSTSLDGSIRVWDRENGREIVRLINFYDGEWVSITPDGYYNASTAAQDGGKYLTAFSGTQLYDMSEYKRRYFRPDIIAQRLRNLIQD